MRFTIAHAVCIGALACLPFTARAQEAVKTGPAPAPSSGGPSATGPAAVAIVRPGCGSGTVVDVDSFVAILTAELRGDGVERVEAVGRADDAGARPLAVISLAVEPCDVSTRDVTVTIEDQATVKRIARRILLRDVADTARPRALALAVAELLRASWMELAMPGAPAPAAPIPPSLRESIARRIGAAVPSNMSVGPGHLFPDGAKDVSIALSWRAFVAGHASMYGGRSGVAFPIPSTSILLRADLVALFGSAQDALGDVALRTVDVGLSGLFATPQDRPVAVAVGPRLELGVAWATGNPADPQTSSFNGEGFVATGSLLAAFRVRISDTWQLALELDAGTTIAPFEALSDGRRVTGIEGAMFGASIGVAQLK